MFHLAIWQNDSYSFNVIEKGKRSLWRCLTIPFDGVIMPTNIYMDRMQYKMSQLVVLNGIENVNQSVSKFHEK